MKVVHCDLKKDEGVDFAGDILDAEVMRRHKAGGFKCVLLSNLLEHVRDREAVAVACEDIVGPGGFMLASVPSSYPYHADPIDTYYRPSPGAGEDVRKERAADRRGSRGTNLCRGN